MRTLLAGVSIVMLTACSAHVPTQLEITAHEKVENSVSSCYKAQEAKNTALATMISSVPKKDRTLITLLALNQQNSKELVAAATGKYNDPCKQTNLFDYLSQEVVSKNKATADLSGKVIGLGKWVVGGLALNSALDKVGSSVINSYAASDNAKINVHSQNPNSGNTVAGDYINQGNSDIDNSTCDNCDGSGETDAVCKVDSDCEEGLICSEGVCTDGAGIDSVCKVDSDCEEGLICSEEGVCTEGASTDPPEFDLHSCLTDPPAGWGISNIPLYNPHCSCTSHSNGDC
jgi:hypothetical protein